MKTTRFGLATAVAVTALGLSVGPTDAHAQAAGADWSRVVAAAEKEGTVVFYTSLVPTAVDAVTAAFQKAYPKIRLQVVRNTEAALIPKVQQEQSVGAAGADLYSGTTYDFYDSQSKANQLVKPIGPNFARFPAASVYGGFAPVVVSLPMGIAYNTNLVKDPPKTYADLLKPEYRGAVGSIVSNASTAVTSWYDYLRTRNPGFWEKFAAQRPTLFPSTIPMTQAVAAGEIKATLFTQPANVNPLVASGAPIKFVIPDPSEVFGIEFMVAVLKNAKNPNAAQVFADFVVSRDGQAALNGNGLGVSVLSGVPGAIPPVKIFVFDPKTYTPDRIKQVNDQWTRVFRP